MLLDWRRPQNDDRPSETLCRLIDQEANDCNATTPTASSAAPNGRYRPIAVIGANFLDVLFAIVEKI
jgi:hypothetical protein